MKDAPDGQYVWGMKHSDDNPEVEWVRIVTFRDGKIASLPDKHKLRYYDTFIRLPEWFIDPNS